MDGNLESGHNVTLYLLDFWYLVWFPLWRTKLTGSFDMKGERANYLLFSIPFSWTSAVISEAFILEGVRPLHSSWMPFALGISHLVKTSWEKMVIEIACELAQDSRTSDGLFWRCRFHKKKRERERERERKKAKEKTSLVSLKQRYFLWKSCMRKEKVLSGLMKRFSEERERSQKFIKSY